MKIILEIPWMTLYAATTAWVFIPGTPWQRAGPSLNRGRRTQESAGSAGPVNAKAAIQLTNDTNNPPTTFVAIGAASTSGVSDPGATGTTVDLEGFNYVRGGHAVQTTSTGSAGIAVSTTIELWQK